MFIANTTPAVDAANTYIHIQYFKNKEYVK